MVVIRAFPRTVDSRVPLAAPALTIGENSGGCPLDGPIAEPL
jgi:hypothetical protein